MYSRFKENILNRGMVMPGDRVWVALSGGADSVCLLSLMKELDGEIELELKAIHVNHLLRGDDSDRDEEFCRDLCRKMNIPLEVYKADVKQYSIDNKTTLEEAGRSVRYGLFEKVCDGRVAIAHHMDDNAETVLMNLMRGTGTSGLTGISDIAGKYIRPLMIFRKREILDYCSAKSLPFREDSSNREIFDLDDAIQFAAGFFTPLITRHAV